MSQPKSSEWVDPPANPAAPREAQKEERRSQRSNDRRISDKIQPLLDRIVGILSADSPRNEFYNITESIQRLLNCQSLRIYGMDRNRRQLFTRNFISPNQREIRWDESKPNLSTYVAKTRKPLFIPCMQRDSAPANLPVGGPNQFQDPVLNQPVTSAIILPLHYEDRLVGVLDAINCVRPEGFAARDFELSKEIGKKLALVLDKLEWVDAEEIYHNLLPAFQSGDSLEALLDTLKPRLQELFRVQTVHFFEYDPKRHDLSLLQWKALGLACETRLPLEGKHFLDPVVRGKKRIFLADVPGLKSGAAESEEALFDPEWDRKLGIVTQSVLATPLLHENRVVGVIQLTNRHGGQALAQRETAYLDQIAQLLGNALTHPAPLTDLRPGKFSYLIENGIISNEELAQAITKSRASKSDVETLLEKELGLSREVIGKSLEQYYGLPYYGYHDAIFLDKDMLEGLNRNFLAKNLWVPIEIEESRVWILINEPEAMEKVQSIKMTFPKKEIQFRVGLKADILDFLNLSFVSSSGESPAGTPDMKQIMEALSSEQGGGFSEILEEEEEFSAINESDSSIVRFVNKMIIDAYEQGASDIHIEPGRDRDDLMVRFRVDGDCRSYQKVPMLYKQAMVSRIKVMALLDISERRLPQDGKIRVKYRQKTIELRVATGPTLGGNEDVVLRLLRSSKPMALEELQLSDPNFQRLRAKIYNPHGLILVVGPTGSGKTTTLHSFLHTLNTPNKKIWTAEDPIEISQAGIRQLQVNPKIGLSFPQAFRFFLRADPDIIMIGEMRDLETMNIALEASLSGHLVLSTLHTNSAPETVNRLLVMGLNPFMFADSLLLIVAQRLVKTLCPDCAESYAPAKKEIDALVDQFGKEAFFRVIKNLPKDLKLKKPTGCSNCNNTGYRGRIGVHEILECTDTIRSLIVQKSPLDKLRKQAMSDGMLTLKQDGILKIFQGHCDFKQVLAVCGG